MPARQSVRVAAQRYASDGARSTHGISADALTNGLPELAAAVKGHAGALLRFIAQREYVNYGEIHQELWNRPRAAQGTALWKKQKDKIHQVVKVLRHRIGHGVLESAEDGYAVDFSQVRAIPPAAPGRRRKEPLPINAVVSERELREVVYRREAGRTFVNGNEALTLLLRDWPRWLAAMRAGRKYWVTVSGVQELADSLADLCVKLEDLKARAAVCGHLRIILKSGAGDVVSLVLEQTGDRFYFSGDLSGAYLQNRHRSLAAQEVAKFGAHPVGQAGAVVQVIDGDTAELKNRFSNACSLDADVMQELIYAFFDAPLRKPIRSEG